MNNKLIKGILVASAVSMGVALLLVIVQIAGYLGAPTPSVRPAASRPASRPAAAPAAPAEPAAGAQETAGE